MRIHYIQHESHETPGAILTWAKNRGHTLSSTMMYNNEPLPTPGSFDLLVIMGGSMSVYDEPRYPWMRTEMDFIAATIGSGKAVLGICLGAQLIAGTLGATVRKNREKEIGWHPVHLTPQGAESELFSAWQQTFPAFHWHGDTFDIPAGAVRAAFSEACDNQAFLYGEKTVALQFHPETTTLDLELFLSNNKRELVGGETFIQTAEQMLAHLHLISEMNGLLYQLLDRMEGRCEVE